MRGAARLGGRSFRPPENIRRGIDPLDVIENAPSFNDLDVAPRLEPINDEWSISDPFEPVDPRDCAKYPASPYCENDLFRIGPPVGFDVDIRINGCTICVYIYPVVGFMRLTPTVICRRDPNCEEDRDPPPRRRQSNRPPRLRTDLPRDENQSQQCINRINLINARVNRSNDFYEGIEEGYNYNIAKSNPNNIRDIKPFKIPTGYDDLQGILIAGDEFFAEGEAGLTYEGFIHRKGDNGDPLSVGIPTSIGYFYVSFNPAPCPNMPPRPTIKPPPPLPPPFGRDDDRKKTGDDKMCCNECKDSKENTDKLLKEIKEIKKAIGTGKLEKALNAAVGIGDDSVTGILNKVARRIGLDSYPIEVPESLLQGQGDKIVKLQSNAEVLYWLIGQVDTLVGQFPIDIEVLDIDPLKAGDQKKKIVLPNIAEAIAEMYGLTIKNSVNQEVELNMLLRLAAEVIATKNAAVVTQDYARANANFLGYKANYKPRELTYNFDFTSANLDPRSKEPIIMENLLKTVKGYVQGWQLEDKETVVGFLQKLMFSAGIIKAVFFRGKGNQKELNREINSMSSDEGKQDKKFEAFIREMNDPNSRYNRTTQEKPEIKQEPDTNPKESK